MRSKSRLPKIFLSVIAATLVVCCAQQRTAQAVVYWVGDGGSNLWDETATAWQTTNPGTSTFSATTSYTDFTDDVVFDRDTTANKTITVRTAGVTPNDLNIDTGVKWIFQPQTVGGGKINAFLDHTATSGGATSMTFRYDSSPGFTGADIRGATIWELSAAASSGSYTFLTAGDIEMATAPFGTPGFTFDVSNTAAGTYTVTDDFVINRAGNIEARVASSGSYNVIFSGDIALNEDLGLVGLPNPKYNPVFTGTITLSGSRTINNNLPGAAFDSSAGSGDFSGATFAGGASTDLTMKTTNADVRGYILPNTGANINVGGLTFQNSSVLINATTASEDYFATLRANGGKVTFDDNNTFTSKVELQSGLFHADDMIFITDNGGDVIDLTFGNNATIDFDLGALTDPENDMISVDGEFNLNGAVQITRLTGMEVGTYDLAMFEAGGFSGSLSNLTLPVGVLATLQLNDSLGSATLLQLSVTEVPAAPEPSTFLLLALGMLAIRKRRRG